MPLIFERIETEGIAELSYLLGDDSEGVAVVFDPTPDVDKYIELARSKSVSITHIFETHIHADLVSGARELCDRVGSAKIYLSHEGEARYGFEHENLKDGDQFTIGNTVLTIKHTPGHTPEHISFLIAEKDHADTPWGVITGDSLFVSSAGRPDLLGSSETNELAEQQFPQGSQAGLSIVPSWIDKNLHALGIERVARERHIALPADERSKSSCRCIHDLEAGCIAHAPDHALRVGRHQLAVPVEKRSIWADHCHGIEQCRSRKTAVDLMKPDHNR